MRTLRYLVAFALAASTATGHAAYARSAIVPETGSDLINLIQPCVTTTGAVPNGEPLRECYDYVAGFVTGTIALATMRHSPTPFCVPEGAHDNDILRSIVDYADKMPDAKTWSAGNLLTAALMTKYVCATVHADAGSQAVAR